jgi:hypothetical protein
VIFILEQLKIGAPTNLPETFAGLGIFVKLSPGRLFSVREISYCDTHYLSLLFFRRTYGFIPFLGHLTFLKNTCTVRVYLPLQVSGNP